MKATVIIPTFNRRSLLKDTIDSWIDQSLEPEEYEIIVVDNNSKDDTESLVNEYILKHGNIKYYKEQRPGLVFVRHAGAKLSNAPILIFADDDGVYNNTCIQELLKVYANFPEVVAVGGKIDIKWDQQPPEWIFPYEGQLGKLDYGSKSFSSNEGVYINGGLFSIRKEILFELNGFNPDQIGDYLVGDGETGLCRKIHKKEWFVGWTPFAKMDHIQFVAKNGTKQDISRRFFNNGICESYAKLRADKFIINKSGIVYFIKTFLKFLKQKKKLLFNKPDPITTLKDIFDLSYTKGQLRFFSLWLSKKFRTACKQENWF